LFTSASLSQFHPHPDSRNHADDMAKATLHDLVATAGGLQTEHCGASTSIVSTTWRLQPADSPTGAARRVTPIAVAAVICPSCNGMWRQLSSKSDCSPAPTVRTATGDPRVGLGPANTNATAARSDRRIFFHADKAFQAACHVAAAFVCAFLRWAIGKFASTFAQRVRARAANSGGGGRQANGGIATSLCFHAVTIGLGWILFWPCSYRTPSRDCFALKYRKATRTSCFRARWRFCAAVRGAPLAPSYSLRPRSSTLGWRGGLIEKCHSAKYAHWCLPGGTSCT